ncbi:hypothetical protein [Acidianus bottle-shaped virus]|uniref:Uncharacterized protein ORF63 n=1 Tax=Acidianus bottle-shaped virus (isolate Italy/Pozzuoli) TaxID=654911 RepID=Y063_ABVP|nr:hypothetical protein ABV_gp20 [Acidianus bottle-shaped virus]A4ZUA6.1 RecName: Full=Uncharacterized protein ORF63 [Acidianus bottle-shaped virus (isolate Pozzuoli)]ABP73410.1 hypothetical protein [Acidianus bottle-shaped virus]
MMTQCKPLSFFLRNGRIIKKTDYGNYIRYEIIIRNQKLAILDCKDNQCIEIASFDLTKINKKK